MKHILYITSQFPTVTETFIAREMTELINQGYQITIGIIRHKKISLEVSDDNFVDVPILRYPFSMLTFLYDILFSFLTKPKVFIGCQLELFQNCIMRPKYALASIYIFLSVCWMYRVPLQE